MEQHLLAYYIGIAIVFLSHIYPLVKPDQTDITMQNHCYANIAAALLIAYYFINKEKKFPSS
jgi:hypothetical protein